MIVKRIATIDAPNNLGLRPLHKGHVPGTWRAPHVLRTLGFHGRLRPWKQFRLQTPPYNPAMHAGSIMNESPLRTFIHDLSDVIAGIIEEDGFPLVLGGDCSNVLAGVRAMRRFNAGLLFLDGHADFRNPHNAAACAFTAAGSDLAIACGRFESRLLDPRDAVAPQQCVQYGEKSLEDPDYPWPDFIESAIHCYSLRRIRRAGVRETIAEAVDLLAAAGPFWLHLDVDILSDAVMPAVDSPDERGLALEELATVLRAALTDRCIGMDVSIYDPDKDPDLAYGRDLCEVLLSAFESPVSVR